MPHFFLLIFASLLFLVTVETLCQVRKIGETETHIDTVSGSPAVNVIYDW